MHIHELFTEQELQDALQLHREQLQRLGATLDDSISEMLQKMLDNYDPDEHIRHELLNEACQLKNRLQSEADKAYREVDK